MLMRSCHWTRIEQEGRSGQATACVEGGMLADTLEQQSTCTIMVIAVLALSAMRHAENSPRTRTTNHPNMTYLGLPYWEYSEEETKRTQDSIDAGAEEAHLYFTRTRRN
jgi:hypothetical protein